MLPGGEPAQLCRHSSHGTAPDMPCVGIGRWPRALGRAAAGIVVWAEPATHGWKQQAQPRTRAGTQWGQDRRWLEQVRKMEVVGQDTEGDQQVSSRRGRASEQEKAKRARAKKRPAACDTSTFIPPAPPKVCLLAGDPVECLTAIHWWRPFATRLENLSGGHCPLWSPTDSLFHMRHEMAVR